MKYERGRKIITKFVTAAPKTYGYRVQKYDLEIEDSEFIKAKGVKRSASKELIFHYFDKCVHDVTNPPISKEQIRLIIKCMLLHAMRSPIKNDKEILDDDGIRAYRHGKNMAFKIFR